MVNNSTAPIDVANNALDIVRNIHDVIPLLSKRSLRGSNETASFCPVRGDPNYTVTASIFEKVFSLT